jgi:hypothetical protein
MVTQLSSGEYFTNSLLGKCVVIGLQSTGEANTLDALDDGEINDFVSTAK